MAEPSEVLTEPPRITDGVERRLDPQFVPYQRAGGWIVTALVSTGALIVTTIIWLAGDSPRWLNLMLGPLWLALTAGLSWLTYSWPVLTHRHTSYTLDAQGIEIRSGVLWRAV